MAPELDLDAYLEQQSKDPLVVTFAGKRYTAPVEIPWTALEKASEIEGKEVSQEKIGEIISLFLGADAWKSMREDGIGFKGALQLMNSLMENALKDLPSEGDPKEAMRRMLSEMEEKEANGSPSPSQTPPGTSAS